MQMTSKPMLIAISAEQADRLYWLGRYVERVFSTVRIFNQSLDRMIDQDGEDYVAFCKRIRFIPIFHGLMTTPSY